MASISKSPFTVATSTIPVAGTLPSLVREAPITPVKPITPTVSPVLTSVDSKSALATIPEMDPLPFAATGVAVGSTSVVVTAPAVAAPVEDVTVTLSAAEQKVIDKLNAKRKKVTFKRKEIVVVDPERTDSDEDTKARASKKVKLVPTKPKSKSDSVTMETDDDKAVDAQAQAVLKQIEARRAKKDIEKKVEGVQFMMPHIQGIMTILIDNDTELTDRMDTVESVIKKSDPMQTRAKADNAISLILKTGDKTRELELANQALVERLSKMEETVAKLTAALEGETKNSLEHFTRLDETVSRMVKGLTETQKQVVELKAENKRITEVTTTMELSLKNLTTSVDQCMKKTQEVPDLAPLTVRSFSDITELVPLPPTQPQSTVVPACSDPSVAHAVAHCTTVYADVKAADINAF